LTEFQKEGLIVEKALKQLKQYYKLRELETGTIVGVSLSKRA